MYYGRLHDHGWYEYTDLAEALNWAGEMEYSNFTVYLYFDSLGEREIFYHTDMPDKKIYVVGNTMNTLRSAVTFASMYRSFVSSNQYEIYISRLMADLVPIFYFRQAPDSELFESVDWVKEGF